MAREWQKEVLGGCLECFPESEAFFVYVVILLVCVAIAWIIGTIVYQVICGPQGASIVSRLDCRSINPENWFPRS